jgi:hypothetical protein
MTWLATNSARGALFDEIVKIGADADSFRERHPVLNALKQTGIAALGTGAGLGGAYALEQTSLGQKILKAKKPASVRTLRGVQIALPILGALALTLGSRYRREMDKQLFGDAPNDRRT